MQPHPKEEEVRFILDAISDYLSVEVQARPSLPTPREAW